MSNTHEFKTFSVEYWDDSRYQWAQFDGGFDSLVHATTLKLALEQADDTTDYRVVTRPNVMYPVVIDVSLSMMAELEL